MTITELGWYPTTHERSGKERIHAVPGHEFSGVVAAIGEEAGAFVVGKQIWTGSRMERLPSIASRSRKTSHSGQLPLRMKREPPYRLEGLPRSRVSLIEPGCSRENGYLSTAAPVQSGFFAVQFAQLHGAHVISTVSRRTCRWSPLSEPIDSGALKTFVSAAVPMKGSAAAYAAAIPQSLGYGKVVITIPQSAA